MSRSLCSNWSKEILISQSAFSWLLLGINIKHMRALDSFIWGISLWKTDTKMKLYNSVWLWFVQHRWENNLLFYIHQHIDYNDYGLNVFFVWHLKWNIIDKT